MSRGWLWGAGKSPFYTLRWKRTKSKQLVYNHVAAPQDSFAVRQRRQMTPWTYVPDKSGSNASHSSCSWRLRYRTLSGTVAPPTQLLPIQVLNYSLSHSAFNSLCNWHSAIWWTETTASREYGVEEGAGWHRCIGNSRSHFVAWGWGMGMGWQRVRERESI
jgi:hypothetical protein